MPQQTINIGAAPDDGTGDTLRVGGDKINDNFTELYTDKADKAGGTFTGDISVPDEAYDATAWNGSLEVPTKNAVRDKIESLSTGGGVDVEDEGVSEATGATTLNFVGAGVTAADAGGGVVDITIPGGGGGIDIEDEGVSEATGAGTLNFTGAGVTATDMGGGVVDVAIPGGGGAAWALAGTGQTATGVYDFAVDGAKANIDFTGLGSFNELLIISRGITTAVSGQRMLRVSTDNGSTFYSTSGDYVTVSNAGVETSTSVMAIHDTGDTVARSMVIRIDNLKGPAKAARSNFTGNEIMFVASSSDINAIRFANLAGGNITGGTVRVYAR